MSNDDQQLFADLGDLVTANSSDRELAQIASAASTTARRYLLPDLLPYLEKVRASKQ
ncbi:Uncharacterised protein [Mycobacteroides abscessus subsp. abscessus]|uniref:hypothetical protein n=1 Tax=Mycobacteroides abscessus TaxID=36809 RepID=UPI0009C8EF6F|nr:hypothetical protein [Mycobacteroides abscessus]SLJ22796.1 Uncharacterised protein [Mycobacteroides abscessus subsp. abscessus]